MKDTHSRRRRRPTEAGDPGDDTSPGISIVDGSTAYSPTIAGELSTALKSLPAPDVPPSRPDRYLGPPISSIGGPGTATASGNGFASFTVPTSSARERLGLDPATGIATDQALPKPLSGAHPGTIAAREFVTKANNREKAIAAIINQSSSK